MGAFDPPIADLVHGSAYLFLTSCLPSVKITKKFFSRKSRKIASQTLRNFARIVILDFEQLCSTNFCDSEKQCTRKLQKLIFIQFWFWHPRTLSAASKNFHVATRSMHSTHLINLQSCSKSKIIIRAEFLGASDAIFDDFREKNYFTLSKSDVTKI